MKKSYSFLQKKVQEIEQAHAQNEDIKARLEFLKNVISVEVSPHPSHSIPPPLRSLSKQLTRIESDYLKGKEYGTTTTSIDDKCDHQEVNADSMPELETVEASPVIAERTIRKYEAIEKTRGLKRYWCWCLALMMNGAIFLVIGATLMLSLCGCDNIRLQCAPGFDTPT